MIHGLIDSSDCWVVNRNKSHAFTLANEGYDVWLANTRGNRYSTLHETLDAKTEVKYWKNAHVLTTRRYDIPAFVEFAKKNSNVKKVTIIGHS
jgi:lysosomal acid lipase/cholesteryl ester hydrolase